MNEQEQIKAFTQDLHNLIQRYADEFDLSTASAVGVLQMKVISLSCDAQRYMEDHPDDEI